MTIQIPVAKTGERKSYMPLWVWRLLQTKMKLQDILRHLEGIDGKSISHDKLQSLGIELHDLDFYSGATCRNIHTYFLPRDDDTFAIVNRINGLNELYTDMFTSFRALKNAQALPHALDYYVPRLFGGCDPEQKGWIQIW